MRRIKGVTLSVAVLGVFWLMALAGFASAAAAEMRVDAPDGAQSVGALFEVKVAITRSEAVWGGYNTHLAYDARVLRVVAVRSGEIADCDADRTWASPASEPTVVAACVFQSSQDTGVTEVIEFECLKDGRSVLHLATTSEDRVQPTTLFDENGATIPTDLVDDQVTCGAGGPLATVAIPTNPPAPATGAVAGAQGDTPSAGQSGGGSEDANGPRAGAGSGFSVSAGIVPVLLLLGILGIVATAIGASAWRRRRDGTSGR